MDEVYDDLDRGRINAADSNILILSRCCLSPDKTRIWYGVHDSKERIVRLYRKGKKINKKTNKPKMYWDRFISDDILITGIIKSNVTTYELQK